jgi:signal recognition particle subunit SRP54
MFESLTQRLSAAFGKLRGTALLTEEGIEEGLREVRAALLEADVHYQVARDFAEAVRKRVLGSARIAGVEPREQFIHACHRELVALLGGEGARLEFAKTPPTVILLAGLQGAGKTTTCAKLAKRLTERYGKRPLMVAADVKRPAAVEQLRVLGAKLGVPVFSLSGASAPEVCAQGLAQAVREGRDVVLLDTAGRLHVDDEMMDEVAEVARRTAPHVQLLVVDAMTGQDAVRSAQAFHQRLELTGVILTKLDGDARGGAALALAAVVGRPILFAGVGEKLEDLDEFAPERMAGRILGLGDVVGLVEQAQAQISESEAQAAYEKMVLGDFTLEDMLAQLRMIQRLGPIKKVLGMLPGMSQLGDLDLADDGRIKRMEALFTSMTREERLRPDLIDMSRRRRIARGAGQSPEAVGELLKGHKGMRQMMKEMNRLGMGAKLGQKAKLDALRALSPTGELAGPGAAGGGLFGGGLGGLFGGAAAGTSGAGGAAGLFGRGRPAGPPQNRQSGSDRRKEKRQKRKKNRR